MFIVVLTVVTIRQDSEISQKLKSLKYFTYNIQRYLLLLPLTFLLLGGSSNSRDLEYDFSIPNFINFKEPAS